MMLSVNQLSSGYGGARILEDVSLAVNTGEIVCLFGRNGAGKTTCLKTIMGLVRPIGGDVRVDGRMVSDWPAHQVPLSGIGYVPQGRRLFGELTVAENIEIGLMSDSKGNAGTRRAELLAMFPRLEERMKQRADTLSGGEQQMLAMARALAISPKVLLLDEPTEGLQPSMIARIRETLTALRDDGVAILLVEQRIDAVLSIADRVVFLDHGRSQPAISAAELNASPDLAKRYLGV